jgi:hypothetical protein
MLIGDGGGGTIWSSMSMDMMRLLIKTPDTAAYYNMLDGWKQSYELLNAHKWQVESYRDALATAWPPEKSEAAQAYVGRLNEMLANLDQTYEAAMQNHRAFADATLSISLAQSDFDRIDQEYAGNQTLLNAFESKMAQDTTTTEKSTPPVADGRQEELRLQAAARLSSVSTDLAQAQAQIRQPVKYDLRPVIDKPGSANDGDAYVPPPIPPITPSYPENEGVADRSKRPSITFPAGGGGSGANTGTSPITAQPVTNLPVTAQPVINPHQPGLVLGGTGGPIAAPQTVGVPPAAPTPGPLANTLPAPGTSPFLPTGGTSTGVTKPGTQRIQKLPGEQAVRPSGISEGMRATPPGGMIGGPSHRSPGQPGSARPGMRRVNPVGGMIGGGEPIARAGGRGSVPLGGEPMAGSGAVGGRPAGGRSRGMPAATKGIPEGERLGGGAGARRALSGQTYRQANGRKPGTRNADELQHWDPENPWEIEEGVDPVLMPPREQRVDPGPAIGLH